MAVAADVDGVAEVVPVGGLGGHELLEEVPGAVLVVVLVDVGAPGVSGGGVLQPMGLLSPIDQGGRPPLGRKD